MVSERLDRFLGWQGAGHETRVRLLETFCRSVRPKSVITNTVTLVLLALALSVDLPALALALWVGAVTALGIAARAYVVLGARRASFMARPTRRALELSAIASLYGLFWGLGPLLFYGDAGGRSQGIMLVVVLLANIMTIYAPIPGMQVARFVPAAGLTLIALALDGDMIVLAAGSILSFWLYLRIDISRSYHAVMRQQFELEDRLRQQSADLERANAAKSEFLAVMSHEIRNPMNGILAIIHLIGGLGLTGKARAYTAHLKSASKHLADLLTGILDLSRLEHGAMAIEAAPFDLRAVIDDVVEIVRPSLESKNLTLSIDLAPGADAVWTGDAKLLRQILLNLLGNAAKFTQKGDVGLRVAPVGPNETNAETSAETAAEAIAFSVSDTGPGIDSGQLQAVLEPFTQAPAGAAIQGGAGLGLTISKRLIEAMGGKLAIESRPGEGSTFSFTLALHRAATASPPPTEETRLALPNLSILHVDDSAFNRLVMREVLETADCHVVEAADGDEALARLATETFDLIITDIQMPGMDGLELIRRVRTSEAAADLAPVPIIVLTAAAAGERARVDSFARTLYLLKPTPVPVLLRSISDMAGGETAAAQSAALLAHLMPKLRDKLRADLRETRAAAEAGDGARLETVLHAAKGHCGLFGLENIDTILTGMGEAAGRQDFRMVLDGADRVERLLSEDNPT